MATCDEVRRAMGHLRDGEAPSLDGSAARAHLEGCAACRADEALLEAVGDRLRERAGPAGPALPPPGLRDAVLARIRGGEAVALELHPFLRRVAAAAAAVLVAATAAAFWQSAHRRPASPGSPPGAPFPSASGPGVTREEVVSLMVRTRFGAGR